MSTALPPSHDRHANRLSLVAIGVSVLSLFGSFAFAYKGNEIQDTSLALAQSEAVASAAADASKVSLQGGQTYTSHDPTKVINASRHPITDVVVENVTYGAASQWTRLPDLGGCEGETDFELHGEHRLHWTDFRGTKWNWAAVSYHEHPGEGAPPGLKLATPGRLDPTGQSGLTEPFAVKGCD